MLVAEIFGSIASTWEEFDNYIVFREAYVYSECEGDLIICRGSLNILYLDNLIQRLKKHIMEVNGAQT